MKKFLLLLVYIIISYNVYSQSNQDGRYHLHFGAGFVLGGIACAPTLVKPGKALWVAPAVGFMAGLSKEFHDYNSGYAMDAKDLGYTVLGGVASGIVMWQVKKAIIKRKARKKTVML